MIPINPQQVLVTRPGVTTYVDHVAVEATSITFMITAEVQPATGRDRQDLPEGYRAGRVLKIYTETELNVIDVPGQRKGDVVSYQGQSFDVTAGDDRIEGIFPVTHYKYILTKVGVDE